MCQETVEILRRSYEAFNRGDTSAWLDSFHPEVQAHDLASVPDAEAVYRGHEGLQEWAAMMSEISEEGRYEPQKSSASGDLVLVAVRTRGRGRASGVSIDIPMFHVFEMQDAKIRRFWAYLDEGEARATAQLDD